MNRPTLLAALLLASACRKDAAPSDGAKAVVSTPVPAPEGLVAEVSARAPDALWGKLQQGVGGPLAHLPPTMGGALAAVAKLDLTLAGEIDGASPAYGVIAHPGQELGWAFAVKLRDVAHARLALLEGKSPRFKGRDADGGLTVLGAPTGDGGPSPGYLLALSPLGYLIVAHSEADLVTLTPYATRTLPTRPASTHGLVISATHAALAGAIHDELLTALGDLRAGATMLDTSMRQQHGGKDPDFGDPQAVIQGLDDFAHTKLAVLADLDHAELTLDAGEDDVDVELSLMPGAGASAKLFSGLRTGDASPMLTLSGDTTAAVLFQDDPASLADSTKAVEERTLAVFKPVLTPKDTTAIHDALAAWAGARGPWLTVGLEMEGAPALTLRTPTTDPDHATRAITNFIDLAQRPVFQKMLEAHLSVEGVSTATAAVPGFGSTSIATFRRRGGGDFPELAIAWATTGDLLHMGAAGSSARALRASKDPPRLLGSDIPLAGKLGTLHDRVAFVFVGRLSASKKVDGPRSSVVLGLGRDKANGWATLDADDTIIREALGRWLDP